MDIYAQRIADPDDPLRDLVEAANDVAIPPTIFMRKRTVESPWWTDEDTMLVMALRGYKAGLCPGGNHVLAETSRADHEDAYMPGERIRCYHCKADAQLARSLSEAKNTDGLLIPIVLDVDAVELNQQPKPPLPPELMMST